MPETPVPANQPGAPPSLPPPPPVGESPAPDGNQSSASSDGKVIMVPTRAMKAIKEEERKKGAASVTATLDKEAQNLGYANHAAMMEHLRAQRASAQAPKPKGNNGAQATPQASETPPAPPKNRNDHQAMQQYDRDRARWQRENEQKDRRFAESEKRRRRAERERDAIEANAKLERIASGCGIKDTSYAIHLLTQHCQGKTLEELGKFDEKAFFDGLRPAHPYLWGEVVVPATTGTSGVVPGSHVPSPASQAGAIPGTVDAMKMTAQEFSRHEQTRGIRRVATGL